MAAKLGNQLFARIREEMSHNIATIKKQFIEWLERPESGDIETLGHKFTEISGGLALLEQNEAAQLSDTVAKGLRHLSQQITQESIGLDQFVDLGAELAAGLLFLEDYIHRLGYVNERDAERLQEVLKSVSTVLTPELRGETKRVRSQISDETYKALSAKIGEMIEQSRNQIDQQVRNPQKNFNTQKVIDQNLELIQIFALLGLDAPQLLLTKINESIKVNLTEKEWIDIAEAMILVEETLKQAQMAEKKILTASENISQAIEKQTTHSRALEVHGLIISTSETASEFFQSLRKDVVHYEKVLTNQPWWEAALRLSRYGAVFELVGFVDFGKALQRLGLAYAELTLQSDTSLANVYPPVVESLAALEFIFNELSENTEAAPQGVNFLSSATQRIQEIIPTSKAAEDLYRSLASYIAEEEGSSVEDLSLSLNDLGTLDSLDADDFSALEEPTPETQDDLEVDFDALGQMGGGSGGSAPSASGMAGTAPPMQASSMSAGMAASSATQESALSAASNVAAGSVAEGAGSAAPAAPSAGASAYFAHKSLDELEALSIPDEKIAFATSHEDAVVDEEIREFFIEEFREIVEQLRGFYPQWRQDPHNERLTNDIRRMFHTLKGSGRTVGYEALGEFAWQHERLLNNVIDKQYQSNILVQDTVSDALDLLNVLEAQELFVEPKGALLRQAMVAEEVRQHLLGENITDELQLKQLSSRMRLAEHGMPLGLGGMVASGESAPVVEHRATGVVTSPASLEEELADFTFNALPELGSLAEDVGEIAELSASTEFSFDTAVSDAETKAQASVAAAQSALEEAKDAAEFSFDTAASDAETKVQASVAAAQSALEEAKDAAEFSFDTAVSDAETKAQASVAAAQSALEEAKDAAEFSFDAAVSDAETKAQASVAATQSALEETAPVSTTDRVRALMESVQHNLPSGISNETYERVLQALYIGAEAAAEDDTVWDTLSAVVSAHWKEKELLQDRGVRTEVAKHLSRALNDHPDFDTLQNILTRAAEQAEQYDYQEAMSIADGTQLDYEALSNDAGFQKHLADQIAKTLADQQVLGQVLAKASEQAVAQATAQVAAQAIEHAVPVAAKTDAGETQAFQATFDRFSQQFTQSALAEVSEQAATKAAEHAMEQAMEQAMDRVAEIQTSAVQAVVEQSLSSQLHDKVLGSLRAGLMAGETDEDGLSALADVVRHRLGETADLQDEATRQAMVSQLSASLSQYASSEMIEEIIDRAAGVKVAAAVEALSAETQANNALSQALHDKLLTTLRAGLMAGETDEDGLSALADVVRHRLGETTDLHNDAVREQVAAQLSTSLANFADESIVRNILERAVSQIDEANALPEGLSEAVYHRVLATLERALIDGGEVDESMKVALANSLSRQIMPPLNDEGMAQLHKALNLHFANRGQDGLEDALDEIFEKLGEMTQDEPALDPSTNQFEAQLSESVETASATIDDAFAELFAEQDEAPAEVVATEQGAFDGAEEHADVSFAASVNDAIEAESVASGANLSLGHYEASSEADSFDIGMTQTDEFVPASQSALSDALDGVAEETSGFSFATGLSDENATDDVSQTVASSELALAAGEMMDGAPSFDVAVKAVEEVAEQSALDVAADGVAEEATTRASSEFSFKSGLQPMGFADESEVPEDAQVIDAPSVKPQMGEGFAESLVQTLGAGLSMGAADDGIGEALSELGEKQPEAPFSANVQKTTQSALKDNSTPALGAKAAPISSLGGSLGRGLSGLGFSGGTAAPAAGSTSAVQRLSQELSNLSQKAVQEEEQISFESNETSRSAVFLRAVDRFENLSQLAEKEQSEELVDELLDSIYDIEDSLTEGAPDWVWQVLDSIEQLLLNYKYTGEFIAPSAAEILRRSAGLIENFKASSDHEVMDTIGDLMGARKQSSSSSAVAESKALSGSAAEEAEAMAFAAPKVAPVPLQELSFEAIPDPNAGSSLAEMFLDEAMDLFGRSHAKLEEWDGDREQLGYLDAVRRNMHTLKGSARMAGYMAIGDLTHSVESLIDSIVDGYAEGSSRAAAILMGAMWQGITMLDSIRDGFLPNPDPYILNNIHGYLNQPLPYPEIAAEVEEEKRFAAQQSYKEVQAAAQREHARAREAAAEQARLEAEKRAREEAEAAAQAARDADNERAQAFAENMDPVLVEIFTDEAQELLSNTSNLLQDSLKDMAVVHELQRAMHTLKGGARLVGLMSIGDTAHLMESVIERVPDFKVDDKIEQAKTLLNHGLDAQYMMLDSVMRFEMPIPETAVNESLRLFAEEGTFTIPAPRLDETMQDNYSDTAESVADEAVANVEQSALAAAEFAPSLDGAEVVDAEQSALATYAAPASDVATRAADDVVGEEVVHASETHETVVHQTVAADSSTATEASEHQLESHTSAETQSALAETVASNDTAMTETAATSSEVVPEATREPVVEEVEEVVSSGKKGKKSRRQERVAEKAAAKAKAEEVSNDAAAQSALVEEAASAAETPALKAAELDAQAEQERLQKERAEKERLEKERIEKERLEKERAEQERAEQERAEQAKRDAEAKAKAEKDKALSAKDKDKAKKDNSDLSRFVRVDSDLLDEMIAMLGESVIMRSRMENVTADSEFNLNELTRVATRIAEQVRRLDSETEAQMLSRRDRIKAHDDETFDPLEMDRFSELQQLSRQLSEAIDDLKSIQDTLSHDNTVLRNLTLQQGAVHRNLQDRLLTTQLMRFDVHEPRLRRLIKQTALSVGKEVNFVLEGGEVELERRLLEDMLPSLEHMIRNSIAHGIERPEERRRAGKPEVGTIKVAVSINSLEISVRIIDDGAGIDYDKIRAKAKQKGWLDEDRAHDENYLNSLMMRSGFSTADSLSQLSGRGVGMDVVHEMLKQRRGQIHAYSIRGKGTEFEVNMPFSMSIAEVLLVDIGGQVFAAPMNSIMAIVQLGRDDLVRSINGETIHYPYQGQDYRLYALGTYFKPEQYEFVSEEAYAPALLINSGGETAAFHVDNIINRLEIIVKNVNRQVLNIPGISGATILGDGRVVPVLELSDLARRIDAVNLNQDTAADEVEVVKNILVVDDSVTMRKVSTRLLERNGYQVATAKDGLDAIDVLASFTPDLIMLDIEMPRMDGFEFATHVRQNSHVPNVPIIMITSRTGDKHRQRADQIGVQGYLGKPYREDVLLDTLDELLNQRGA